MTINWVDIHDFAVGQRAQRFPLILGGKARLLYLSMHPFQGNLEKLEERFRTQFSKLGNTSCFIHGNYFTFMKGRDN